MDRFLYTEILDKTVLSLFQKSEDLRYIRHLRQAIPCIIKLNGDATGL